MKKYLQTYQGMQKLARKGVRKKKTDPEERGGRAERREGENCNKKTNIDALLFEAFSPCVETHFIFSVPLWAGTAVLLRAQPACGIESWGCCLGCQSSCWGAQPVGVRCSLQAVPWSCCSAPQSWHHVKHSTGWERLLAAHNCRNYRSQGSSYKSSDITHTDLQKAKTVR